MSTLGFVSISPKHEEAFAVKLAKSAASFGIEVVRFTPLDLQPGSNVIQGRQYSAEKGDFEHAKFSIPNLIYDRCLYQQNSVSKKAKPIMDWLKKYPKTQFLSLGFPANKWLLYQHLHTNDSLRPYLPTCSILKDSAVIVAYLKEYSACMLKPLSHELGTKPIYIYMNDQQKLTTCFYQKKQKQEMTFSNQSLFESWSKKYLNRYMIQSINSSQTNDLLSVEIRIFLMKNKQNQWDIIGKCIKKENQMNFLMISQITEHMLGFDDYLKSLKPELKQLLLDDISTICSAFLDLFNTQFPLLFEVALDICHTNEGQLYISNVISKPGRSSLLEAFPEKENDIVNAILHRCLNTINENKVVQHDQKAILDRHSSKK
ncbi:YheC/YheD family protein [Bacillus sp. NPDC077027]|uniref:YheC/YheD family protein n=1 Tax=Bacillus sp. NPDC077027 TaxID=3390548 RepID=UPI003CFD95AD